MRGELLPIIPDPMMELMKLKDAAIVDLLDAETLGGWINVLPSSPLSCIEIHMSRSTINIHERAEFNQPSSPSNTASLYLQSHFCALVRSLSAPLLHASSSVGNWHWFVTRRSSNISLNDAL